MKSMHLWFVAVGAVATMSGCAKSGSKPPLTQEAFAAAVSKCQPLDSRLVVNSDGPPSVEITIPRGASTVPDCMAREFDGFSLKQLQISYAPDQGRS